MAKRQFHLSWFLSQGYGPKTWRGNWPGSDVARWMMPDLFLDLARGLERACFDYVIIEDSSMVPYTFQGSHDTYLRYAASTPKLDPAVLVPYLAQATRHLGLVPTLSVTEYPPFLLARLVNSLDHVTEGRIGWNCVTSSNDGAAQNYGHAGQPAHDERYDVGRRIHRPGHQAVGRVGAGRRGDRPRCTDVRRRGKGPSGQSRGKILPLPGTAECTPLTAGAAADLPGRRVAARAGIRRALGGHDHHRCQQRRGDEGLSSERAPQRAAAAGRDPDTIKLLFLAYPLVDTTMEAAKERRRLLREDANRHLDMQLSGMSRLTNIDFSKFDPDEPLPELFTNGHRSSLTKWIGKTPREVAVGRSNNSMGIDLTGTVDHVAGTMQEIMQEVGGDGFLFFNTYFDRRYIMEVCDGLVPELQRRGLTRTRYAHKHFKDNLMEF